MSKVCVAFWVQCVIVIRPLALHEALCNYKYHCNVWEYLGDLVFGLPPVLEAYACDSDVL